LIKYRALLDASQISVLATGFIVSFIVALISVKFLINYIRKNNFKPFGWYRVVLGLIIIGYFLFK